MKGLVRTTETALVRLSLAVLDSHYPLAISPVVSVFRLVTTVRAGVVCPALRGRFKTRLARGSEMQTAVLVGPIWSSAVLQVHAATAFICETRLIRLGRGFLITVVFSVARTGLSTAACLSDTVIRKVSRAIYGLRSSFRAISIIVGHSTTTDYRKGLAIVFFGLAKVRGPAAGSSVALPAGLLRRKSGRRRITNFCVRINGTAISAARRSRHFPVVGPTLAPLTSSGFEGRRRAAESLPKLARKSH